jgi:hypothetical protein
MAYSLQGNQREPDYKKRLPQLSEIKRETQIAEKLREDPAPKTLGPRSRQMAVLLTLVGLATFVVPLITSVPSVMGRTDWSPWEMFMGVTGNTLPAAVILTAQGMHDVRWLILADTALLGALFDYSLLAAALISVMGHASRKVIGSAGALGVLATLVEMRQFADFQLAIFGGTPASLGGQHVDAMTWAVVMLVVMALLLVVAVLKEFDADLPANL